MKVKAAVVAAVAIQQVQAQTAQKTQTNPFNFFGQPQPMPTGTQTAGTDPISQMMAHGHAMMFGQPASGQTAGAAMDPFKMMGDAAAQANTHMTNMHAAANQMFQQGNTAAQQMMDAGSQTMMGAHQQVMGMMTTTFAPAQEGPISRSCPTKIECFSDSFPGMSCSGVQGGAACINGKMFPIPASGICSCNDPQQVCSFRPTPTAFSLAQCTPPAHAYIGVNPNSTLRAAAIPAPTVGAVVSTSFAATGSSTAAAKPATCAGRCDTAYDPSFPCQCNNQCFDHNNCCIDKGLCGLTTTLPSAAVVIDGTTLPNLLSTTVNTNAYDWVPGFKPVSTSDDNSRLYDANMEVDESSQGPSSKMLMAVTVCMLTYATMIFAVVRGVSFVRRRLSDQRQIDFLDVDGLDEELALEGPVE